LTIYQRTPDGQWAAYSPESALPRRLKIFLKAIDGKMTEEVYAKNLVAFGDVREVLKSLQESGLIEDVMIARARSLNTLADSPTALENPAPAAQRAAGPSPVFQQEPQASSYRTITPTTQAGYAAADTVSVPPERYLKLAIEAMSGFVLVHLPGSAFQVLLEIEALQSVDQLLAMMDGYAQFVRTAGDSGVAHLNELNHLISLASGPRMNLKTEVNA
jgi:hypothetical protein